MRTRIKIDGVGRVEDGRAAARLGADAVGMIFHPPARRNVPVEQAGGIVAALPAFVMPVGVFVDSPAEQVAQTARRLGLGCVQLHGEESPQQVAALRPLGVIKALRVEGDFGRVLAAWRAAVADLELTNLKGIVLDTAGTGGGSGQENDWQRIRRHQEAGDFGGLGAVIAAGGLTPDNVADVVRLLRPWAVDVSSGVEQQYGEKSAERIAQFVAAVKAADPPGTVHE